MYNFILVNNDTDSVTVCKPDQSPWTEDEQQQFIDNVNNQFPQLIKFSHDGYFNKIIVVKSKNYILYDGKKIKTKGSSIRDQKKEPALREMMDKFIDAMLFDRTDTLVDIYHSYIHEALNVKDIKRWSMKKTITESILKCKGWTEEDILSKRLRKNETDVWDAIKHLDDLQAGGKVYCYPTVLSSSVETKEYKNGNTKEKVSQITGLKTIDLWTGDENKEKLIERVYDTVSIFASVIDLSQFIDYTKKKNKPLLEGLK